MKKVLSLLTITASLFTIGLINNANAATYTVTPKAPKITPSLKPMIAKYRQNNFVGAMQDLEELVKKEKNNLYARYYLALCYTQLGYKEEAKIIYKEVVEKDENLALSYYSQRALDCLENPDSQTCSPSGVKAEEKQEELTDMDIFILSGKRIHPSAMDRITKEKMDRKLQEEEYIRKQKEQELNADGELQSYNQPTNEEIANALNILSKIGMNPYNQFNPLASIQQYDQFGTIGINNPNIYNAFINGANPESAKMFLYNQMLQQNNMMNYGI